MKVLTILVVDDNPTILATLQPVLQEAGYRVVTADDGDRAVELIRAAKSPGLLVVLRAIGTGLEDPDIDLVDLNGDSELLRRISNARIDRVLFKANHRRGRSFAIGLARKAKRRIT